MTQPNIISFPATGASAKLSSLSRREYEALMLAAMGLRDKEIAEEMGITYSTARAFMRHISMKLGTSCRTEATMLMDQAERERVVRSMEERRAA